MSIASQLALIAHSPVVALIKAPSPVSELLRSPSPFHKGLLFLWKFAWKSRIRLSYLIILAFMVLDIHMTLEVRVDLDIGGNDFIEEEDGESDTGSEFEE